MVNNQYIVWPNVPHQIPYRMNIPCLQEVQGYVDMMAGFFVNVLQSRGHENEARHQAFLNLSANSYNNNIFTKYLSFAMDYLYLYMRQNSRENEQTCVATVAEHVAVFATHDAAKANNDQIYYNLDRQTQQAVDNIASFYNNVYNNIEDLRRRINTPPQQQWNAGGNNNFSSNSSSFMGGSPANRSFPGSNNFNHNTATLGAANIEPAPLKTTAERTVMNNQTKQQVTPPTLPAVFITDVASYSENIKKYTFKENIFPVFNGNTHILISRLKEGVYHTTPVLKEGLHVDFEKHQNKHLISPRYQSFDIASLIELNDEEKLLEDTKEIIGSLEAKIITSNFSSDIKFPYVLLATKVEACTDYSNLCGEALSICEIEDWERNCSGLGFSSVQFFNSCFTDDTSIKIIKKILAVKNDFESLYSYTMDLFKEHDALNPQLIGKLNTILTKTVNRVLRLLDLGVSIDSFSEDCMELAEVVEDCCNYAGINPVSGMNEIINNIKHSLFATNYVNLYNHYHGEPQALGVNSILLGTEEYHLYIPLLSNAVVANCISDVSIVTKEFTPELHDLLSKVRIESPSAYRCVIHTVDDILLNVYYSTDGKIFVTQLDL